MKIQISDIKQNRRFGETYLKDSFEDSIRKEKEKEINNLGYDEEGNYDKTLEDKQLNDKGRITKEELFGYDTKNLRKRMYEIGWCDAIEEFEELLDEYDNKDWREEPFYIIKGQIKHKLQKLKEKK